MDYTISLDILIWFVFRSSKVRVREVPVLLHHILPTYCFLLGRISCTLMRKGLLFVAPFEPVSINSLQTVEIVLVGELPPVFDSYFCFCFAELEAISTLFFLGIHIFDSLIVFTVFTKHVLVKINKDTQIWG